jgi:biopolymer transport protein ExbD
MSWSVRHEGSPRVIEGLTVEQVAEGLRENSWESTDEVRGPNDADWRSLENHPQFAELAYELEPPPRREGDDETRLDMNPLIDVCLVLLIFFMLTTTYAALQKYLESTAETTTQALPGTPKMTKGEIENLAIKVTAKMEGDKPVIKVEDKPVEIENLGKKLKDMAKTSKKANVWLDIDNKVPYGTMISIYDQAGEADVTVLLQVDAPAGGKKK